LHSCLIKMKKMEKITLKKDIDVVYITASSFPEGVLAAHQKLHSLVPFTNTRGYYGISHGNTEGGITYKAAAEVLKGEKGKYNLEKFIIKKGNYLCEDLKNFTKDPSMITTTFQKLLTDPNLDPNGYCLEIYEGENDVKCMVKLRD
jgi:predicted transcriptional regulator YdeE